MQVIIELRIDMLDVIKTAIEDGSADHMIRFKDGSDVLLAEVEFLDLVDTGDAQYAFRALDGTSSLRAAVVADGRVSKFTIEGVSSGLKPSALLGSVGKLASTNDIRFNKLDWSQGASITINNLFIYVKQGT